jgi:hypothetical protein
MDTKTQRFATMSLEWWDKHFDWKQQGCYVLTDKTEEHLSYIFYSMDRDFQYLTIHNIFTPLTQQRHGYAQELLKIIFDVALKRCVGRFKITSISKSLDFYLSMGFIYWGINSVGDYYCDLPMPINGLTDLTRMITASDSKQLMGRHVQKIYKKVYENSLKLSDPQATVYKLDKVKLKDSYRYETLLNLQKEL